MKTTLARYIRVLFIGMFVLLALGYPSISTSASSLNADSYTTIFEHPQANFKIVMSKNIDCSYGSINCASSRKGDYHTGVDSSSDKIIRPVGPGKVTTIPMGECIKVKGKLLCSDHGMGNVVIIEHTLLQGQKIYSLYAHLETISPNINNTCISKEEQIGTMGGSGYGSLTYWTPHLHLEFKALPVLGDPKTARNVYESDYWGYISKKATDPNPDNWGYYDPMIFLETEQAYTCAAIQTPTAKITVGNHPNAIAINETTNHIYVSNESDATMSVINGVDNSVTSIPIAWASESIAVNPVTNRIYVAQTYVGQVLVIDGTNNDPILNIGFGSAEIIPDIAVNPNKDQIYVILQTRQQLFISTSPISTTIDLPPNPVRVAINPNNNRIYVLSGTTPSQVSVINEDTKEIIATIPVGNNARYIAVNTASGNVYVSNEGDGSVTVIDGIKNDVTTTLWVGQFPEGISVDSVRNRIYVALGGENTIQVIDGATNRPIALVTVGNRPLPVAVNSATNKVYAGNYNDGTVDVFLGP